MDMLGNLLKLISPLPDGDMSDRLNYCYTTCMLVIFSVFISGWSFVGQPIHCWFPAYYKGWWNEYALDYCFVQNTYFLPFTEERSDNYWEIASNLVHIPQNITSREEKLIGYYQWVPFVLAIEAILFYLPVVIWRGIYKKNTEQSERDANISMVSKFMSYSTDIAEHMHGGLRSFMVGRYVCTLYLLVKLLFAVNCVAQFFMLQAFLGLNNSWWGIDIFSNLIAGKEWSDTGHFPRVTLCDFEVRVLGNLHRHTVQCVLMINMFNEKVFVFLWWWFFIVAIISVLSFLYWLISTVTERGGQRVINNYLDQIDRDVARSGRRKALVKQFLRDRLKADGIFLLRLIAANSGDLVTCQLIAELWRNFRKQKGLDLTPMNEHATLPATVNVARRGNGTYSSGHQMPLPPPYSEDERPLIDRQEKNNPPSNVSESML